MPYKLSTFIVPMKPTSTVVKYRDDCNTIRYTVRGCSDVQSFVRGKDLVIKLRNDSKEIVLDFPCVSDAKAALMPSKDALELACTNAEAASGGGGGGGGNANIIAQDMPVTVDGQLVLEFPPSVIPLEVEFVVVNTVVIDANDWLYNTTASPRQIVILPSLPYPLETTDTVTAYYRLV
jgi:hypothetical protein